jgi:Zn-dependent peptidase ImmA (M78 family)
MRRMKGNVPFIPDEHLEMMAEALLATSVTKGISVQFPIPVESIAERVLNLDMDWIDLGDSNAMARLNYSEWKIQPNESLRDFFDRVPGAYLYTLAHEIFHAIAHIEEIDPSQQSLELSTETVLSRHRVVPRAPTPGEARREFQAQRFAAYLTMPKSLLLAKVDGLDLCNRVVLRQVADEIGVSLQALKIRLQSLGRLYETPDGQLYPSKEAAHGQLPLL